MRLLPAEITKTCPKVIRPMQVQAMELKRVCRKVTEPLPEKFPAMGMVPVWRIWLKAGMSRVEKRQPPTQVVHLRPVSVAKRD